MSLLGLVTHFLLTEEATFEPFRTLSTQSTRNLGYYHSGDITRTIPLFLFAIFGGVRYRLRRAEGCLTRRVTQCPVDMPAFNIKS